MRAPSFKFVFGNLTGNLWSFVTAGRNGRMLGFALALAVGSVAPTGVASAQTAPAAKPATASKTPAKPAAKSAAKPAAAATPAAASKTAAGKPAAAKSDPAPATDGAPPPADSSPMADLKKSEAAVKKALAKQAPDWSPEKDAKTSEVRKMVGKLIDFDELSRRALIKHWDGLTPAQRKEFVETFQELVERSYLKQIHGRPEYELKFLKETKDGREGKVSATLDTTNRGKKVQVALEYKLAWKGDEWRVYDVVTDEQSLLETYRAEFNKIIAKDGFDALLARMKKKLGTTDAQAQKK